MIWPHLAAIILSLTSAGSAASSKMDPNISFGSCDGPGQPIMLTANASTRVYSGELSGTDDPASVIAGDYCAGYLPQQPQFCVSVPAGGGSFFFEVTEAEQIDTVLALTGRGLVGVCDDDGGSSLLSRLVYWLDAGQYQLYVGSYSQGASARFSLEVGTSTW